MKKFISGLLTLTMALTMALPLAACGGGSGQNELDIEKVDENRTQIFVYNYNGGYGSDWLAKAKAAYEELHKDTVYEDGKTGIQIIVQNQKETMENNPETTLMTNNDLFFTENVAYRSLVATGAFEDITDTVTKANTYESTKTIASKLSDEQKDYYAVEGKYYGIPHYLGSYGLVYDVDMFNSRGYYFKANLDEGVTPTDELTVEDLSKIITEDYFIASDSDKKSAGPNGIDENGAGDDGLPATYMEFYLLCQYIEEDSYTPLIWTGKYHDQYLTNLMTSMVANHEGLDQMMLNYTHSGTAKSLGRLNSNGEFVADEADTPITASNAYELARQEGKYYGLQFIHKLSTTDQWQYKKNFNNSFSHMDAQRIFINSISSNEKRIAMMVEGSWWESEATQAFNDMVASKGETYSKENRNFGWMPFPHATTAQIGNKDTYFDSLYSLCFIKSGLTDFQKKKAMDFLQFVHTDAALVEFTQTTGATKAYNYSMTDTEMNGLTPFAKSLTEYRLNADVIYAFSSSSTFVNNQSTFKPMNAYRTYIADSLVNYAPTAFNEDGVNANDYFKGMASYFENIWSTLK